MLLCAMEEKFDSICGFTWGETWSQIVHDQMECLQKSCLWPWRI
jgi:hypothetical protein